VPPRGLAASDHLHLTRYDSKTADRKPYDLIQRVFFKRTFYGYRRVAAILRRQSMAVNAKRFEGLCAMIT